MREKRVEECLEGRRGWRGERKWEKGEDGEIDGEKGGQWCESDYGMELICGVFVELIVDVNV